jgi:glycosyltransferase involved in cell wall biosynthesis
MNPRRPERVVRYYRRATTGDGGMTHAVRRWAESTAEAGVRSTIAFDRGTPRDPRSGVEWVDVPHLGPSWARIPRDFGSTIHRDDVVVLHSGWNLGNLFAGASARAQGASYILEPRGAYDPHIVNRHHLLKRGWWLAAERELVSKALAIHVFFEEEREHLEALGYSGPVIIAPNGVDSPGTPPWRGGAGYLLWLGRFDPEHKAMDLLVEAVAHLPRADRPRIRLHGPDRRGGRAAVASLIRRLDVRDSISVGPALYGESKREMLVNCDGFLYPSRWDACPNAVLESVALGVPTLCGPYPLGTNLAAAGAALQADSDPVMIASRLLQFRDRARMAAMGAAGARLAREGFGWSDSANSWLLQADDLLGGQSQSFQPAGLAHGQGGIRTSD